jgi:hypothetical protein
MNAHTQEVSQGELKQLYPHRTDLSITLIRNAMTGRSHDVFTERLIDQGVYQFDYCDPGVVHFVCGRKKHEGIGVGREAEEKAAIRCELRGLVIAATGKVLVRGLHKFFNLGQHKEFSLARLSELPIVSVTEKLDGQMIYGVLIRDQVQF